MIWKYIANSLTTQTISIVAIIISITQISNIAFISIFKVYKYWPTKSITLKRLKFLINNICAIKMSQNLTLNWYVKIFITQKHSECYFLLRMNHSDKTMHVSSEHSPTVKHLTPQLMLTSTIIATFRPKGSQSYSLFPVMIEFTA